MFDYITIRKFPKKNCFEEMRIGKTQKNIFSCFAADFNVVIYVIQLKSIYHLL